MDLPVGDHVLTLRVTDRAGVTGTDELVVQVVDTIPPVVTLISPVGRRLVRPAGIPFAVVFASSDACGVRHEVVELAGCTIYDGWTDGDGDGLLSDETLLLDRAALCRVASRCGVTKLHRPALRVEATDCGGNVGSASRTLPGGVALIPGLCGR